MWRQEWIPVCLTPVHPSLNHYTIEEKIFSWYLYEKRKNWLHTKELKWFSFHCGQNLHCNKQSCLTSSKIWFTELLCCDYGFPYPNLAHEASLLAQTVKICLWFRRTGFDPSVGKTPWRRKWLTTPIFLPGEFHGHRSLVGYLWGHKGLDTTEGLTHTPTHTIWILSDVLFTGNSFQRKTFAVQFWKRSSSPDNWFC